MKRNFQFYKNIILVLASALTLVAVTFAWFSNSSENLIPNLQSNVGGEVVKVSFYSADEDGNYSPLDGDITLDNFVPGNYNRYKLVMKAGTTDPLKMNFAVSDLPTDMPEALKNSVSVKYVLKSAVKETDSKGNVTYTDDATITETNGYQKLSSFENGEFFTGISLAKYQAEGVDTFIIYYEIGLAEDSESGIEGLSSSLGNVRVSVQLAG